MMNPYTVLGIPPTATDREVREAYLAAIHNFPPEVAPERFRVISQAYELVKDRPRRLRYILFNEDMPGDSPLDVLVNRTRLGGPPRPMAADEMRRFLRDCAKR